MASILLPWVEDLGLRHQGVLMSAMRGCDVAVRHDPSKLAQRLLRAAVFLPHAGRMANPRSYITIEEDVETFWSQALKFLNSWDHYPNHYVWHFIHAAEIIGYLGPEGRPVYSERWMEFYQRACLVHHVSPETIGQMNGRLRAEEAEFYARQEQIRGEIR